MKQERARAAKRRAELREHGATHPSELVA